MDEYDGFSGPYRLFLTKRRLEAYCASFGWCDDDGQGHRGYQAHWDGQGWYGQDSFVDCLNERVVMMVPVKDLRRGYEQQIQTAEFRLREIASLPPVTAV